MSAAARGLLICTGMAPCLAAWVASACRPAAGPPSPPLGLRSLQGQAVKEAVWTPLAKALAPSGAAGGDAVLAGLKPLLDRFVGLFAAGSSSDGGEGQRLAGEPCTGEPQQPFLLLRFHLGKKPKAGVQHGGAAYIKAGSTEVFVRWGRRRGGDRRLGRLQQLWPRGAQPAACCPLLLIPACLQPLAPPIPV